MTAWELLQAIGFVAGPLILGGLALLIAWRALDEDWPSDEGPGGATT